ncbi:protein of unknown function [Mucilaginibacter lappiensis]|uniref:DUF5020 family protein n=1 Tax=Mucilaginibacter lappiensis TaxID=354630 RepID=A0ABR6PS48_9SPHI|nr:DUF5020 family protein [Mucilaginibacter lappiensis]MBB6112569.1 hypothetical protein [Mucilaginibacter lappiensis]SIS03242.1 protein of unknown function [Mucilaginibacter lappiensis]
MKFLLLSVLLFLGINVSAQSLQLHYDLRHTLDPSHNPQNFPTLYFEYFKIQDTTKSFVKLGAFLLKTQVDFTGEQSNIGQFYMQVFQQFRFWKPKIFISIQYSGGLGITTPRQYSYYIQNTYSIGLTYPFKLGNAFVSSGVDLKHTTFAKPSSDLSYSFYFWKGLFNYRMEFSGDFSIWTQNKNHGDNLTIGLHGKQLLFFAEPQFWYKLNKTVAAGTKINMYYHTLTPDDILHTYPSIAFRLKL